MSIYHEHPQVHALTLSHHCLLRFRERTNTDKSVDATSLETALNTLLGEAEISHWPPAWADNSDYDYESAWWALTTDFAFPLRALGNGSYLVLTCLKRPRSYTQL